MFTVRPLKPIDRPTKIRRLHGKFSVLAHATLRYVERVNPNSKVLEAEEEIMEAVGRACRSKAEPTPRRVGVAYECTNRYGRRFRAVLDAPFSDGGRIVITVLGAKSQRQEDSCRSESR
jgi:hypothetical protein